jgi:transcriptional regulator with XRE-family HTH domain
MNTVFNSNTWRKLRNKKYRDAFVAAQLKRGIPFQIAAMRKKLGWSQDQLAEAAGVTQGVISRAENPNYGNLTFNTVLRIASGFDAAFVGWFVPFSKLTERFESLSEESVQVPTFTEEDQAECCENEPAKQDSIVISNVCDSVTIEDSMQIRVISASAKEAISDRSAQQAQEILPALGSVRYTLGTGRSLGIQSEIERKAA